MEARKDCVMGSYTILASQPVHTVATETKCSISFYPQTRHYVFKNEPMRAIQSNLYIQM